jgi:hypothetical protein
MKSLAQSALILLFLVVACARSDAADIFNKTDLTGFTQVGNMTWSVNGGVLSNDTPGNGNAWLSYNPTLDGYGFAFSITEKVAVNTGASFPRPRIHFTSTFFQLYIGNEGFIDQYGIFGSDVTNALFVNSPVYTPGQYDTLTFVASGSSLSLYLDNTLIETATRTIVRPVNIAVVPGDGFSQDTMSITSMDLIAVPEPASFSIVAMTGVLLLARPRSRH